MSKLKDKINGYEKSIEKWRIEDEDEWDNGYTDGVEDVIRQIKKAIEEDKKK